MRVGFSNTAPRSYVLLPATSFLAGAGSRSRPTADRLVDQAGDPRASGPDPVHVAAVQRDRRLLAELGHDVRRGRPALPGPDARVRAAVLRGAPHRGRRGRALRPARAPDPADLPDGLLGAPRRPSTGRCARPRRCPRRRTGSSTTCDVLLTPTIAHRPPRVRPPRRASARSGPSLRAMPAIAYAALWNVAGNPAASVPCGLAADGLPLAVQLVGRTDDEATLFSLSAQLEQARPWPLVAGTAEPQCGCDGGRSAAWRLLDRRAPGCRRGAARPADRRPSQPARGRTVLVTGRVLGHRRGHRARGAPARRAGAPGGPPRRRAGPGARGDRGRRRHGARRTPATSPTATPSTRWSRGCSPSTARSTTWSTTPAARSGARCT